MSKEAFDIYKVKERFCMYSEDTFKILGFHTPRPHMDRPLPSVPCTKEDVKLVRDNKYTHVLLDEAGAISNFYIKEIAPEEVLAANLIKRVRAYKKESDPLFFESQYTDDPKDRNRWKDAVLAIKTRFPIA